MVSECAEWCESIREKYQIEPQVSWGRLQVGDVRKTYQKRRCGHYFKIKFTESLPMSVCGYNEYKAAQQDSSSFPLIAIMAASTTRGVGDVSMDSFSLFTMLLPSLLRSVECGYRYVFVLGYDAGDPFFDSTQVHTEC